MGASVNRDRERYDLTNTHIYLQGDGANWIQTGLDWLPNARFVLDKYHKNKSLKQLTAGLEKEDRKKMEKAIRIALKVYFSNLVHGVIEKAPGREEAIRESATYLWSNVSGIRICKVDQKANNGGATEPHVSHILSARLSSRPRVWSKRTLTQFAPILASQSGIKICTKEKAITKLFLFQEKAVKKAQRQMKYHAGLPTQKICHHSLPKRLDEERVF